MRFALTAIDRYLGLCETLLDAGWTWLRLFTPPESTGGAFPNAAIMALARKAAVPIQHSPILESDFQELSAAHCDALIVASYNHRIGQWRPYLPYAVNFHPSPLPLGRGPYPLVRAIRDRHPHWGISCHQLSEQYDRGDVLDQELFDLDARETHESLDLKIQMAARRLGARVANGFEVLWTNAQPQVDAEWWPLWTATERAIDFSQTVAVIDCQIRAFGLHGTIARLQGYTLRVTRAHTWIEAHGRRPGSVAHAYGKTLVVAATDGYVALTDWTPEAIDGLRN